MWAPILFRGSGCVERINISVNKVVFPKRRDKACVLINMQKEMYHTKFIPPSMALSSEGSPCENSLKFLLTTPPTMCICENQLAHYNWNGTIPPDLPLLCKRVLGDCSPKRTVASPVRSQDDTERESKHGSVVDAMVTDILTRLSI